MQPRQVLPNQFYLITRRCTQRQFLLRPDAATNNAFTYCLIEAAQRYGVDVVLPCALSNHYHAVIFDRSGRYPAFIEHFHKMFARSQNALLADVNYIHPTTTTTLPHRSPFDDRGSWSWLV
jgi:putative transposase